MRTRTTAWVSATLIVAISSTLASQQTQVFRAVTDRVRVDVVVTDSRDRPVTDLTGADFDIIQAGRPQTITDFRLMSIPLADRTPDLSGRGRPPADVATNAPLPARPL
jgi:hypothetical protein